MSHWASRLHIVKVEPAKPIFREGRPGERNSYAQNEVSGRRPHIRCGLRKPVRERHELIETHALDLVVLVRRDTARVLEQGRDEPVIAGRKFARNIRPPTYSS